MKKALNKPYIAIGFLVVAIVFIILNYAFTDYNYDSYTDISSNWISDYQVSPSGYQAYIDGEYTIFCNDPEGNLAYRIEYLDDSRYTRYVEICFDDMDHLYVHKIVFSDDAYVTQTEAIEEYDTDGNFVKYIALFDYSRDQHKPHRENRIAGLNYRDGHIGYMYLNFDGSYNMYDCDLSTLVTECNDSFSTDGYATICAVSSFSNGDYAVILTNGSVGRLTPEGNLTIYAECDYSLDNLENSYLPTDVFVIDDEVYVVSGTMGKDVYKVGNGQVTKICSVDEVLGFDDWDIQFDTITKIDDRLTVVSNGIFSLLNDQGEVIESFVPNFDLGFGFSIQSLVKDYAIFVAVVCGSIGFILLIGCIAKWKATLLLKQLCMTIPLVVILVVALLITMKNAVEKSYDDTLTQEMVAINELIAKNIDGDEIASIVDMDAVNNGMVQKYCDYLNDAVGHNSGFWNKNFDIGIFAIDSDTRTYVQVAGNYDFMMPFKNENYDESDDEYGYEDTSIEDSDSEVLYINDGTNITNLIVDTPIYDEGGNRVAVLELSADISTVDDNINAMTKKVGAFAAIFLPIFCLALGIISYINIRYLNKLSDVVSDISEGDFKARVKRIPNDEVGQICSNVNQMAEQLDDYFSTLDRNEKFYYKFVPEKFRELLHKEEFTDLALGDAESADLTVLFCDIRAFSLNSEMMTAKENFEFVNIVYGKAGPIIRAHNGFIDKYIGDAIMALFENADDAVAAGREMYREIVLNPNTAKELGVSSINIGIGIHSGMARIGIVGEDERMSGTVISNTVNLSSRLESLTKKYAAAMLISKDTLDRLSDPDSLNTRYLGMIQVAGVNEVKAVYEVLDCLGSEDEAFKSGQKNDLKEAIRLFHLGKQEEALEILKKLKAEKDKQNANDPALDMYVEYIEEGIRTGNKDTKIFRFSRK